MDINLFNYDFPENLIAQHPLPKRSASRLMVVDPVKQSWEHRRFVDISEYFGPEDLLVFNDARVMPSRLYGETKRGRRIEVLLLEQKSQTEWSCLVRPANKIENQTELSFGDTLRGVLTGAKDQWTIQFSVGAHGRAPLHDLIAELGLPPLPPYIQREDPFADKDKDADRYQTVYAKTLGSAAAPTAGFHFTPEIKQHLRDRGCELAYITLHVGRDTFQPVRAERIEEHPMHGESFVIPQKTATQVMRAKKEGRRVSAIGTTTVRALESAWDSGYTEKFITPGYQFQIVDRLLTNFHQPKSTLLMLVSALAGREFVLECYQEAIREEYRLFSFGDAMLILK